MDRSHPQDTEDTASTAGPTPTLLTREEEEGEASIMRIEPYEEEDDVTASAALGHMTPTVLDHEMDALLASLDAEQNKGLSDIVQRSEQGLGITSSTVSRTPTAEERARVFDNLTKCDDWIGGTDSRTALSSLRAVLPPDEGRALETTMAKMVRQARTITAHAYAKARADRERRDAAESSVATLRAEKGLMVSTASVLSRTLREQVAATTEAQRQNERLLLAQDALLKVHKSILQTAPQALAVHAVETAVPQVWASADPGYVTPGVLGGRNRPRTSLGAAPEGASGRPRGMIAGGGGGGGGGGDDDDDGDKGREYNPEWPHDRDTPGAGGDLPRTPTPPRNPAPPDEGAVALATLIATLTTQKGRGPRIEVPRPRVYTAKDKFQPWFDSWLRYAKNTGVDPAKYTATIFAYLDVEVQHNMTHHLKVEYDPPEEAPWEVLKEALYSAYGDITESRDTAKALRLLKQNQFRAQEFILWYDTKLSQIRDTDMPNTWEVIENFIDGFNSSRLREALKMGTGGQPFQTYLDCRNRAKDLLHRNNKLYQGPGRYEYDGNTTGGKGDAKEKSTPLDKEGATPRRRNRLPWTPRKGDDTKEANPKDGGRIVTFPKGKTGETPWKDRVKRDRSDITCHNCNEKGHYKSECTKGNKRQGSGTSKGGEKRQKTGTGPEN